jgi:hypothetical protein
MHTYAEQLVLQMNGFMHWPCCIWNFTDLFPADTASVLATYEPGKVLVRFYGAFEFAWLRPAGITHFSSSCPKTKSKLVCMPRTDTRRYYGASTINQLASRECGAAEVQRLSHLAKDEVRVQSFAEGLLQVYLLFAPVAVVFLGHHNVQRAARCWHSSYMSATHDFITKPSPDSANAFMAFYACERNLAGICWLG